MSPILNIAIFILMGWVTAHFAQQRGRDPAIWFFVGMFLGIIGLLLLFLLPTAAEGQEKTDSTPFNREETPHDSSLQTVEIKPETVDVKPEYMIHDWYYLDQDRKQQGPVAFDVLKKEWMNQKINLLTYVWSQGMESWKKIEELPDLRNALS